MSHKCHSPRTSSVLQPTPIIFMGVSVWGWFVYAYNLNDERSMCRPLEVTSGSLAFLDRLTFLKPV